MTEKTLRGGCLCGEVLYEIYGEPQRFYHCHCKRCRKASGTGHASNLMVKTAGITWLAGESNISAFKVPEAERFTNTFCKTCGGRLPRYVAETGFAIIPAGSLDSDPGIAPQARIFWDSKEAWSCGGDDIPVFAEYIS